MIKNDGFWEKEVDAPLLNRNAGYITREGVDSLLARAADWMEMVSARGEIVIPTWETSCFDSELQRIFELDAERTFKDEQHRRNLIETLSTIYKHTRDYHQGMGFIVAFLLLFLKKEQVAALVLGLDRYYVKGYFKAAPVAYVRDARTFDRILQKTFPKVHDRISCLVPPEAYCSKWFVGFNVHVLPFPALAAFLDEFFRSDEQFRFQYAMSLVKNTEQDILKTNDVGRILECLRLDSARYPDNMAALEPEREETPGSFFTKIIQDAVEMDMNHVDLDAIRKSVLDEMAQETLKRKVADSLLADDDEIVFSDED